jgi:phage/plasmid-like protein (TIGR03299 family)
MPDYFETGFSVRQPMWHGKGNILAEYPENWAEARVAAGLEWEPMLVPTFEFRGVTDTGAPTGVPVEAVAGDYFEDPERRRVMRDDTGKTLAVVNSSYPLITHEEMGSVVDAILDTEHVRYETAGAIDEGKGVWALALLDEPVTLEGTYGKDNSVTLPYLALLNRHDAGGAFSLTTTAVRVVCANTWKAAELDGKKNGTTYSFRHTKNWRDRVEEAKVAITGARTEFAAYCELATELLGIKVTAKQAELFIEAMIPTPPTGIISDRVMGNIEQARAHIRACLYSSTTNEVSHTAYGLVQAAGEYADHIKTARSWETRLNRSLLSVDDTKKRAAKIARQVVTV